MKGFKEGKKRKEGEVGDILERVIEKPEEKEKKRKKNMSERRTRVIEEKNPRKV